MSKRKKTNEATGAVGKAGEPRVLEARMNADGTATVKLAYGGAVPYNPLSSRHFSTSPLLSTGVIPDDFHQLVPIMRYYYENDALFGTVVDVCVQLALDNTIRNITDDDKTQQFFDALVETSNLRQTVRAVALDQFIINNVFPYRSSKPKERIKARNGVKVPAYKWTVLNPEHVIVGDSILFGEPTYYLKPNDELINLAKELKEKKIEGILDKEYIDLIAQGGNIPLDPSRIYHVSRHKQPFQRYGPVLLKRVLKPLKMKECYMQMDLSTANGLIEQVVVFKLGSDEHPITDPAIFDKFLELLRTNSKAYQLVWNHALEIDYIRSDVTALDPKKYEFINKELMYGFAVPSVLLGDSESGYSKGYLSVKSLVERLKWVRQEIETWLEHEYRIIAEENGLKTHPIPRIGVVNLEEERTFKSILLNLYQHGVISAQTLLSESGYDLSTELERMLVEKEIRDEAGILVPRSPYQASKDNPEGGTPTQSPGRPEGVEDTKDREDRNPLPAPSGSGSEEAKQFKKIALGASSDFERLEQEYYLKRLVALYGAVRDRIMEGIEQSGVEYELEAVYSVLADFRQQMEDLGTETINSVYSYVYDNELVFRDEGEYNRYLSKTLNWNGFYVDKLFNDLQSQVISAFSLQSPYEIKQAVALVFNKEQYRLKMFAREGVIKARAGAVVAAHLVQGYTSATWICMFRNSCPECIERHGRVYSLDEVYDFYPAHNNCECELSFTKE